MEIKRGVISEGFELIVKVILSLLSSIGEISNLVSVYKVLVSNVKLIELFNGVISSSFSFPQYFIKAMLIGPFADAVYKEFIIKNYVSIYKYINEKNNIITSKYIYLAN